MSIYNRICFRNVTWHFGFEVILWKWDLSNIHTTAGSSWRSRWLFFISLHCLDTHHTRRPCEMIRLQDPASCGQSSKLDNWWHQAKRMIQSSFRVSFFCRAVKYWTQNLSCDSSTVIVSDCMDSAHSELTDILGRESGKQTASCLPGAFMNSPSFFITYNLHTVVWNCTPAYLQVGGKLWFIETEGHFMCT